MGCCVKDHGLMQNDHMQKGRAVGDDTREKNGRGAEFIILESAGKVALGYSQSVTCPSPLAGSNLIPNHDGPLPPKDRTARVSLLLERAIGNFE